MKTNNSNLMKELRQIRSLTLQVLLSSEVTTQFDVDVFQECEQKLWHRKLQRLVEEEMDLYEIGYEVSYLQGCFEECLYYSSENDSPSLQFPPQIAYFLLIYFGVDILGTDEWSKAVNKHSHLIS